MKVSHSPGPWIARQYRLDAWAIDPGEGMMPIAHVAGSIPCRPDEAVQNPITDANARLIAAAPELLEAVKNLVKEIHEHRLLDVKKRFSLCTADAQAGTAIAKAEGRTVS